MKFGEQLEQNLVPEWRAQYLSYKTGKRYIKAISRAAAQSDRGVARRQTFTIKSPFTPHREYTRMPTVHFENEDEPHSTPANDIPLEPLTAPREAQSMLPDARETIDDSSAISDTIARNGTPHNSPRPRPVVAPLAIPNERTNMAKKVSILSPDTPGALQRIATFVRIPTMSLEKTMDASSIATLREEEFFNFLDKELKKVQTFYEEKEQQAEQRLAMLRQQLHIMKTRRQQELKQRDVSFLRKRFSRPGKTAEAVPFTPITASAGYDRDYVQKRAAAEDASYRSARQKIKLAIQEFYRSLELLKAYCLLNLTAFRKLCKKCDKVNRQNGRSANDYFHDAVLPSSFVKSNLIEDQVEHAEDLYTRYFEDGNRKLARTKLRRLASAEGDKAASAFFNGVLIGIGLTFAVEGVVYGVKKLSDEDEDIRAQTSYLLQIYGGYFLMLYLFVWFCFCCRIWNAFKVNYAFIFEFDPKHNLNWKQLSEFPSFLTLLFGIIIWLNFSDVAMDVMYLWYPVILIGVTIITIFLPLPIWRWRSRQWFVVAHGRLLFSGLLAVEFRDFFLGDMYCSLVYAVANAELFFCLYAKSWEDPIRCDSSRSILLGFLAALPPIWRALQCIRRFWDSRAIFPHLANLLKYLFTIATAITLSLYRRGGSQLTLILFIAFSSVNAFYALTWDIFMDFSLLQPGSKNVGLRDILAFDSQKWMYYSIIVIDPVLRFGWVFLAIFSRNIQHGSVVAFFVAFVEVTRRGLWTIFRVENEHCTNISLSKASRDIPLPYEIKPETEDILASASLIQNDHLAKPSTPALEAGQGEGIRFPGQSPIMAVYRSFSRRLAHAHAQDFQRRTTTMSMESHAPIREDDHTLQRAASSDAENEDSGEGRRGIHENDAGENVPEAQ